jgi:branched-chain amino acid transport system substrate-binding protein
MSTPRIGRRRLLVGSVAVAAITALSACGDSTEATSGSGGKGVIKVGTSLPLTGAMSQPGTAAKQGYETWAAMVNENGGLLGRKVELVVKDDASDQNTVVADYNALITRDKVDLLIGTHSSLLNLPASAVAERNKRLYVEPAGGSPQMFDRGFKYLFFTQQATADQSGVAFARWVASLPAEQRPRTAAYPSLDDPFTAPAAATIREILEKVGVKTVYDTKYAIDTKNFDAMAASLKAAAPDLIVHGAGFEDGVGLVRAMLSAGVKPGLFYQMGAPGMGKQYADAIGAANTQGIFYSTSHAPQAKTPGNPEFVAKYKELFGGEPPEDSADSFAAGEVLQAAVEAVGSIEDQAKLADWLRGNSVDTILGKLSWNANGSPKGEYLIGQWQDGKIEFVLPKAAASSNRIIQGWGPGAR